MRLGRWAARAVGLCLGVTSLQGQATGSLEVGASVVEYDGFLTSGAVVVAPALTYDAPTLSLAARSTWTKFESGNGIIQATAAAAWLTPASGRWRVEFAGSLGAAKYADTPGYGHLLVRSRLHYRHPGRGAWASASTGAAFGQASDAPLELGVGGWLVQGQWAFTGGLTRSWVSGGGYLDFNVAARWVGRFAVLDLEAGARPSSRSSSSTIPAGIGTYAEAAALVKINERVAATLSGGEYPTDPIRGLLGARYLTVGLRVHFVTSERSSPVSRVVSDAFGRSADLLARSTDASEAQLEQVSSGSLTTLRLTVPGASSVEVMGDFTDWAATPLREVRPAVWILTMPIEPGTHRLNVRVNGGEWRVPRGTRLEEGEFGGAVGVIVIP